MGGFEGIVTHEELLLLAEYDDWATDRLLGAVARLPGEAWTRRVDSGVPCLRDALVRLVNSTVVWLARWQGHPLVVGLHAAGFTHPQALQQRWRAVTASRRELLEAIPEARLHAPLAYRTATGRERSEVFARTVLHLIMHAAHQRGRVVALMRLLGASGVHTDLLHFLRCRGAHGQ